MRILQILPQLNVGGVETGTVDLAKALKEAGDEPYVISAGGSLVGELIKQGIPHFDLPVHKKSIFALSLVKPLARYIEREKIDIVHARSRVPAWIAYLATRRLGCDFVTTCHGYYSKHFFSHVMGWGKKVIVISHLIGRHMIDNFGVPQDRISLIYRGVDLSKFDYSADKYLKPVSDRNYIVVNIGRITPIKGYPNFIRAVHLASKSLPNLEAWIVGSPDRKRENYLEELKNLVRRLGLEDKIKFLGKRYDISNILQQADLSVLSANAQEAFGRVVVEAGASGTAVVATKVGGVSEIIDDGENGLLVPPEDEAKMADAMIRLLTDRELSNVFAKRLREKVEKNFSLEQLYKKTIEVYKEVKHKKNILVIKLGALGDLILATPSLRMIRRKYPSAKISLMVDTKFSSLMQSCPYADEVIPFGRDNKKNRWFRLLKFSKNLRRKDFDFSIDLQNTTQTHLAAYLAGIPRRFGYRRKFTGVLLTNGVENYKKAIPPVQHQFKVLERAGINEFDEKLELWPREEDEGYITRILGEAWHNPSQRLVGISLGASERWLTKRWPLENFAELTKLLAEKLNVRVALIGTGSEDAKMAWNLTRMAGCETINLVGKTNLGQLISLVKRLDILIAGDSAPIHIASAVDTFFIALFGPTDPFRHLAPGKNYTVIKKNIKCSPCYKESCRHMSCMKKISVDEVFQSVKNKLHTISSLAKEA